MKRESWNKVGVEERDAARLRKPRDLVVSFTEERLACSGVQVVTVEIQGVFATIAFDATTRELIASGLCSPEMVDRAWCFLYGEKVGND